MYPTSLCFHADGLLGFLITGSCFALASSKLFFNLQRIVYVRGAQNDFKSILDAACSILTQHGFPRSHGDPVHDSFKCIRLLASASMHVREKVAHMVLQIQVLQPQSRCRFSFFIMILEFLAFCSKIEFHSPDKESVILQ